MRIDMTSISDSGPAPFEILAPPQWTAPAVFNSPHSGRHLRGFLSCASRGCSPLSLRKSEDCYVDELFMACIDHGAPMLRAHVPRSYIDLNREPYELDPRMFSGELPGYANTGSPRVAGGLGTIPRIVSPKARTSIAAASTSPRPCGASIRSTCPITAPSRR